MNFIESCFSQSEVLDVPENFSLSLRCKTCLKTFVSKLEFDLLGSFTSPLQSLIIVPEKTSYIQCGKVKRKWPCHSGFLPGIFSGGDKIYCYANFFIVLGRNLGSGLQKSLEGGKLLLFRGGVSPPPPFEGKPAIRR